jgi:DNA-directed RNA polymerase subunit RPC12/RpoP
VFTWGDEHKTAPIHRFLCYRLPPWQTATPTSPFSHAVIPMEKKYFVDVFSYVCPACKQRVSDKAYFAVIEEREIGAARRAGLLTYKCTHCGASHSSKSVHTNVSAHPSTRLRPSSIRGMVAGSPYVR